MSGALPPDTAASRLHQPAARTFTMVTLALWLFAFYLHHTGWLLDSMMLMHWTVIKFLFVVHPLTHLIKRCHHWTCLIFLVWEIFWMATFSGFICHISLKSDLWYRWCQDAGNGGCLENDSDIFTRRRKLAGVALHVSQCYSLGTWHKYVFGAKINGNWIIFRFNLILPPISPPRPHLPHRGAARQC